MQYARTLPAAMKPVAGSPTTRSFPTPSNERVDGEGVLLGGTRPETDYGLAGA